MRFIAPAILISACTVAACSSDDPTGSGATPAAPACTTSDECTSPEAPLCDAATKACVALPPAHQLGVGDGSSSSVKLKLFGDVGPDARPNDLAFNPKVPGELWVIGYANDTAHVASGIGTDRVSWAAYLDPAARHFMHKTSALAMGDGTDFATCGNNDNSQNGPANMFMGPALFTTDLNVFAKATPGGLGSHIDMLHNSPFCRGIAHEAGRIYWAFNAHDSSIDRYDFGLDHGPGNDDHSDGTIRRYAYGLVKGAEDDTVSHVAFDAATKKLYIADTGNKRIVALDTTRGTLGNPLERRNEPLKEDGYMDGTAVEVVVAPGTLEAPAGLELHEGLLFVSDAKTSKIHAFDTKGALVRSLDTGLAPGSLAGMTFGPDGHLWLVDRKSGKVYRVDRA